ncbi:hypothetical protein KP509_36G037700 [Ceratopteris richardii]|uniref:pantothenate kinase n=1 Tax=Ceratopteris richardii TaxID=49495 RepID=A0A8T2QDI9_CERRI|nr:hypothetical protein KP509_36G037700 [Ceratopteris richardii]
MDEEPVTLSLKALLRPLIIPGSDSNKDLILETYNGSYASQSHHAYLNTAYLLSPINPVAWKGASPRARFGLDIGGTLCKVVFFEPFDYLDSTTPLSRGTKCSSTDILSGQNGLDIDNEAVSITHSCLEECCCSLKFQNFFPRESISCKTPLVGRSAGISSQEDCMLDLNENSSSTYTANEISKTDDLFSMRSNLDRESAMHSNHVHKLWASIHDPIILLGRGTLFFKCFETSRMEEFLYLTKEHSLVTDRRALGATGGGARKFGSKFWEIAGLRLSHFDELKSLVRGIDFLMKYAQHESFEYPKGSFQGGLIQRPFRSVEDSSSECDETLSEEEILESVDQLSKCKVALEKTTSDAKDHATAKFRAVFCSGLTKCGVTEEAQTLYPYLVVNIGSGVSILLVESPEQFKRVGGTSLGGSTFLGLTAALTGCTSFKEAIELAAAGDSTEIDMLVGDIYGGDYSEMGLAATTVASSFGKLVQPLRRDAAMQTPQHLAKATLLMITNNIGSLAKLHAESTGVKHVLFTGSFLHGNKLAMRLLAVAMEFWSRGHIKAIFLRHEGHAGAMGALLSALDPSNQTDALLLK